MSSQPQGDVHRYTARCRWEGTTSVSYEHYDRTHTAWASPATAALRLTSGDPGRGTPEDLNPEQLVLLAASSCQLLWFLHVAARGRVDVLEYDDDAEAEMRADDLPARLTAIRLRPRIVVTEGTSEARVRHLVELAHRECYIANSLRTPIAIEPRIEIRTRPAGP